MSFLDGDAAQEENRHLEDLRAMRELTGYQKKDEIRADRGDLLESLGAQGSVTFGFVVRGEPSSAHGVRCTAAVTPTEIVLLDDEIFRSPAPGVFEAMGEPILEDERQEAAEPVIARVPRDGLNVELTGPGEGPTKVTIGTPSDDPEVEPDEVALGAHVVFTWPAGKISVAFATEEGAQEALDLLRRKLNPTSPDLSDPGGTMPA